LQATFEVVYILDYTCTGIQPLKLCCKQQNGNWWRPRNEARICSKLFTGLH